MSRVESAASRLRRQIDASLAEERRLEAEELGSVISVEAVLWMAVAPFWTTPLARAANLPTNNLDSVFEKMVELQRAEVWRPSEEEPLAEPIYTLTASARAEALLTQDPVDVLKIAEAAAAGIAKANIPAEQIPSDTWRWASLARFIRDRGTLQQRFLQAMEEHVRAGDTAQALRLIDAARPIAALLSSALDNHMNLALQQAARQIELAQRAAHDQSRLRYFVQRKAQTEAFRRLMSGKDGAWALHYLGAGGVGKTMLIRDLACNVAPTEFQAAVARVDFDYLNPDYPFQSPGLLLWSFAEELRAWDRDGRASRLFDRARASLELLHQRLRGVRTSSNRPSDNPAVAEACSYYADAFRALGRPVILIVDTCEELAKVRPENVDETFRILALLQAQYQELKVICAGRRLLASGGFGWRTTAPVEHPFRPSLALCVVQGFSEEETNEFLGQTMKVKPGLWPAIKSQAKWTGGSSYQIEYTGEQPASPPGPRYHPFELRIFADWAIDDPNLDQETISNATIEQYVQIRILQRLRDPSLEKLLPGVALLRHFERDSLQRIGLEQEDDAFDKLRQQDWINGRTITGTGNEGARTVLDADNATCDRLAAYYQATDVSFGDLKTRAREYLQDQTLHGNLATLDWLIFDSTLRLFSDDPSAGIAWWEAVQRRIARERGYAWLLTVSRGLLGDGGAADGADNPFYLAAITSEAVACEKMDAPREALNRWDEALRLLDPNATERVLQAKAHRLTLAAKLGQPIDRDVLLEVFRQFQAVPLDFEKQATFISLAESLVEKAEITPFTEIAELQQATLMVEVEGPLLNAFRSSLRARLFVLQGNLPLADIQFRAAIGFAHEAEKAPADMPDWTPPADPLARICLEQLRGSYPAPPLFSEIQVAYPYPPFANADQDRLASAQVLMYLAHRLRTRVGPRVGTVTPPLDEYKPVCNAHREIPPYFVADSAVLMTIGRFDEALQVLDPVFKSPSVYSLPSLQSAVLQQLRILRRMRRTGSPSAGIDFVEPTPAILREVWAIRALDSTPGAPFRADDPGMVHALWQTANAHSQSEVNELLQWVQGSLSGFIQTGWATGSAEEVALALDLYEAQIIAQRNKNSLALGKIKISLSSADSGKWWLDHPSQPEQALRIWVRTHALLGDANDPPDNLLDQLGQRRAAEIALDEGELLSLRLRDLSISIFKVALRSFQNANDNIGAFVSEVLIALMGNSSLSPVKRAYEAADLKLQTWEQLEAIAQGTRDFHVDALFKGEWGGWQLRVVHLIGRRQGRELRDTYDGVPLPTDFVPAASQRKPWYWLRFRLLPWGKVGGYAAAIVSLAAILITGYFLLTWGVRASGYVQRYGLWVRLALCLVAFSAQFARNKFYPRLPIARVSYLAGLFGLAIGMAFIKFLPEKVDFTLLAIASLVVVGAGYYDTLRSLYLSRSQLDLSAVLTPKTVAIRFHRWNPIWKYLADDNADIGYSVREMTVVLEAFIDLSSDPGARYSELWEQTPESMRTDLAHVADLLGNRAIEVRIAASPELDGTCWEALFDGPGEDLRNFHFRRSRSRRKAHATSGPALLTVLGDVSATAPARSAWGELWRRDSRSRETTILHLVGSVQQGSAANVLSIAGQTTSFTAEELVRLYPEVVLCIVQGEPSPIGFSERTPSDRFEAAVTRRFCGELFDSGWDAVLVVPALPVADAAKILVVLAGLIRKQPRKGNVALLRAVHEMKRLVLLQDRTAGYEWALDLCLFLTENWHVPKLEAS